MTEPTSPDTKFNANESSTKKNIMGHIEHLNIFLQRKKPHELDIKTIDQNKKNSITDSIHSETLRNPGMWMLPHEMEPVYGLKYIEPPRTMRGKSAHDVFFVEAKIGGVSAEITVKPFVPQNKQGEDNKKSAPKNSLLEFINTVLVAQKDIKTFEPIAVIIDGGTGFYLSKTKKGIKALDQQTWPNYITDQNKENRSEISEKLNGVAICLADMHKKGIIHGDSQIKNFATTPDGIIFPIDWEGSKVYKNITKDQFIAGSERDLKDLLESLYRLPNNTDQYKYSGVGTFHVSSPQLNVWQPFNETVFKPYLDELIFKKKNNTSLAFDLVDAAGELEKNIKRVAQSPEVYAKT